ncbi:P-loop containing nucleoside triphosphate hydrolase protein [Flagelloscypha sp. PMI_526]|nr:P-loop containing nucleoside triphosphate hydrolase protein [Flagelloscypha sp. PMI_526]
MPKHAALQDASGKPERSIYATNYDHDTLRSTSTQTRSSHSLSPSDDKPAVPSDTTQEMPAPSFFKLFSLLTFRQLLLIAFPAIILSLASGCLAPFMTYVIGQVFDAFARYSGQPANSTRNSTLLNSINLSALELIGLGVGSFLLSFVTSWMWIQVGERVTLRLRSNVYAALANKPMAWYDIRLDADKSGSAGLMTQFSKETDEVREAASLACGNILQHLTTVIACLVLAFLRSPILTLVILATLPALMLIQVASQIFSAGLLKREEEQLGEASTVIDRSITGISTVKGYNAAKWEEGNLAHVLNLWKKTITGLGALWGLTSGLSEFASLAMFVQAFWFGGKMVADGKVKAGDVMAIFWACLIAMSNLQMLTPQLMVITRGRFALGSLMALAHDSSPPSQKNKVVPTYFHGELNLHKVSFAYPSRPTERVLRRTSLYLPACETTFIVGESGSGKSTVAQLLLGMYTPTSGSVTADRHSVHHLDSAWLRRNICCLSQTGVVFEMSLHDNIAMGVVGMGKDPKEVTRKEVKNVCVAALLDNFVRELPNGYDTKLGPNGTTLSGGQIQRLEIARALLRDPPVLILDEATSALDITTRLLVFQAIRKRRRNRTTVVITHDLTQIDGQDFVYFMKHGHVAEQGFRRDLEQNSGDFRRLLRSQPTQAEFTSITPGASPAPAASTNLGDTLGGMGQMLSTGIGRHPSTRAAQRRSPTLPMGSWRQDTTELRKSIAHRRSFYTSNDSRATLVPPLRHAPTTGSLDEKVQAADQEATQAAFAASAAATASRRGHRPDVRKQWTPAEISAAEKTSIHDESPNTSRLSFPAIVRSVYSGLPHKILLFFALLISLGSGAMTPVFSFFLSRLMFEVSIGTPSLSNLNLFGGITLAMAALDGFLLMAKFFLFEVIGITWVTRVQKQGYHRVLLQEKAWFDDPSHGASILTQRLVKDPEDARDLPALLGRMLVVVAMFCVGLIWALTLGWQLTLAGCAIIPVFVAVLAVQARFAQIMQLKSKAAKEVVATTFYETISNIRAVRSMGLDGVLQESFDHAARRAYRRGVKSGSLEGVAFGTTNGLIYLAEALLFYVGAVLLTNGTYTYLQMIQTLNLVIFSVTVGSQMLGFMNGLAKAVEGAAALLAFASLPDDGHETAGTLKPKNMDSIGFHSVQFRYPLRPEDAVFRGLDLYIPGGQHVAIVGASGCGKSTITALLQRLYQPSRGIVSIGGQDISMFDIEYLRHCVTVVSQKQHCFEGTIRDNIAYGNPTLTDTELRFAAEQAHVHEFISQLPNGYRTQLGEHGTQLSGGQAQRVQIARALSRPSEVLVLDECTSALDSTTQDAVCKSIRHARVGRTTIWITHKLAVMQGCDRIVVLDGGRVVEEGTYDDLMMSKGTFMKLASGGEWA